MQEEKMTKAARHAETRAALMAAARALFTERGYGQTGTEDVVRRAGVTRGALYYHFADKEALFAAVFEAVAREVMHATDAAAMAAAGGSGADARGALLAGAKAFIDAALAPETKRIYLLDAPAVLGWRRWREIDLRYSVGSLRSGLAAVLKAYPDPSLDLDALTHLLAGALNEAALYLADSDPQGLDALKLERTFIALIERLFAGATTHRMAPG